MNWTPSNNNSWNAYAKLLYAVDKCLGNLINLGRVPVIKSMFWFQGENDSILEVGEEHARSYSSYFIKFQGALKKRYKNYLSNDFRWISAGIATTKPSSWAYPEIINSQLREYSDVYIPETETLDRINNSHYTMTSYLTIGELFGRYYLN